MSVRTEEAVISIDESGRLVYKSDERGNQVPDFSNCGYKGGGVALPDIDAVEVLLPQEAGDDTRRIQAAINHVAALPEDDDGFRGAILLKHGKYRISGSVHIRSGGIVLRGEGQEEEGTTLIATGKGKRTLIEIGGKKEVDVLEDARVKIVDDYVPVGARSFRVESVDTFVEGGEVIVFRPSTAKWIQAIGMDRIEVKDEKTRQWEPGQYDLKCRRAIIRIEGNRLTLDAPIVQAIEAEYGGGAVYGYRDPGRIERVGVENLRGVSEFDDSISDERRDGECADEDHGWNLITVSGAQDGWVKQVTSQHFGYSCVYLRSGAHRFTVQDSECLDPVSQVTGGRRYSFAIAGQMNLVQRCRTRRGRHDYVLHARAAGPNAFVDCIAEDAFSDSGPHHRWSVGTLFDNIRVEGNAINVQDRQSSGTGHGWAGAMKVLWNCEAESLVCQKPPTSQNYAIGCIGEKRNGWHEREDGHWESHGTHVKPRSLYLSQLRDRFGWEQVTLLRANASPA